MKMKKKVYRIVTAVLLVIAAAFARMWAAVPVQAAALTVYINGTELQNGKYYEFVTSGFTVTMNEVDSDSGLTDYISYNNGVMEVHGNVNIYSKGIDTAGVLRIENGTLTLKGDGGLFIKNTDAASVVTGTSDSVLKTDNYTGSISFNGKNGSSLIQGLALVDLKTTGKIDFSGSNITGNAFISAGSVNLEANDYYFDLYNTMNVKYFIEATDMQNGKISISKTGTTNALRLKNGYASPPSDNIYVSDAFFKATDTVIASNGSNSSDESIFFNGNSITEGNLEIQSKYGVTITTKNTLADGNLKITSDMGHYVTLTSEAGSLSTGDADINAGSAWTILNGKGSDATIKGNATIKANVLEITGEQNSAIAGNANLTTVYNIKLSSATGYSVIAGSTIQMDAGNCDISISRGGSGATDTPPILGGNLQTSKGAVHYEDGGTRWIQLMETGKIYYANSCEHPIVNGSSGQCLVCGDYNIEYAEVIGADGTSKGTLSGDFGGGYPTDDLNNQIEDGDTIKFLTDVYCPARNASMRPNIAVKLDLNGHALTVQSVSSSAGLAIMNGTYAGNITGDSSNGLLTFLNAKATLPSLSWNNSTTGVKLENSQVTIAAAGTADTCRFEKLTMNENSTLVLQNATDGISNDGLKTLEDSLGSIQDFLPKGYSLTNTNSVNTIVDTNGNPAANIVLRYRKLTDNDVNITMDTVFVYDKIAKEPELLVTYEGQELEKGTDYTVAYTNNINAGNAVATITGKGAYHGSVQLPFTIEKANQAAPAGILAINVSKSGMQDGAIENLSTAMEYSTDGINWITVTSGTRMNELAAGDYYVRYAATENYLASPATKIVVGVAKAATTEAGSTSEAATAGANGTTAVETKTGGKGEKHVATGDETPLEMLLILMLSTSGITFAVIAGNKKKHN